MCLVRRTLLARFMDSISGVSGSRCDRRTRESSALDVRSQRFATHGKSRSTVTLARHQIETNFSGHDDIVFSAVITVAAAASTVRESRGSGLARTALRKIWRDLRLLM